MLDNVQWLLSLIFHPRFLRRGPFPLIARAEMVDYAST
jgi:hypothetical protein